MFGAEIVLHYDTTADGKANEYLQAREKKDPVFHRP